MYLAIFYHKNSGYSYRLFISREAAITAAREWTYGFRDREFTREGDSWMESAGSFSVSVEKVEVEK